MAKKDKKQSKKHSKKNKHSKPPTEIPAVKPTQEPTSKPADKTPDRPKAIFIEAEYAEKGERFLNWSLTTVLEYTGKSSRPLKGMTRNEIELMFIGWDINGNALSESGFRKYYPLRVDPVGVARVMAAYEVIRARLDAKASKDGKRRAQTEEVTVVDPDGQVRIEVRPKAKKESKPRGVKNTKTDCLEGTSGHSVGLIMLDEKPGKGHRLRSVERMVKELSMLKSLAQSWYSTHAKRRSEIYGALDKK